VPAIDPGFLPPYTTDANLTGTIDEVAYYPTVLSADRVLAHYNAALEQYDWVQPTVTDTAPTGAAFAAIIATVLSPGDGEHHRMMCAQFGITAKFSSAYFAPGSGPGGVQSMQALTYDDNGVLVAIG
jgi:hypothetical protein